MMIHSVYFWLKEDLSETDRESFENGMRALFEIDCVQSGEIGEAANTPDRPVTQNTFDYALFLRFESVDDHDAYQVHPDHDVFVKEFSPWFETVQVYDTQFL